MPTSISRPPSRNPLRRGEGEQDRGRKPPPLVGGGRAAAHAPSKAEIRDKALALGFDAVGFTTPDATEEAGARLREFLALGRHGDMGWLAAKADRRVSPAALWAEAKSVVMLAMNYGPEADPLAVLERRDRGAISVYAQGRDYHDLIKGRLKQLAHWIAHRRRADVKVFVDTAPVLEKPLAQAAGLGWQGKHTNLVSREFGSWCFLGAVFTTLALEADAAERDHCGSCQACLDICPTHAFPAPYQLDARRCISYLTIEHAGPIPREFRTAIGNRIYGCDDCLAVCPWNKWAKPVRESALRARPELDAPALAGLAALDDAGFRRLFSGTAVKRIGRDRFLRNVLLALGNSGDPAAVPIVRARLHDASPLVRGAAVWALSRLLPPAELLPLRPDDEPDHDVRTEWRAALPNARPLGLMPASKHPE
jgi:epoxyqueuosine reductase